LRYFPLNLNINITVSIMFIMGLFMVATTIYLYYVSHFSLIYLITVVVLGMIMLIALGYLIMNSNSGLAWKIYKYSSFPYLGIVFLVMVVDSLIL
jgi:heme O synthase-like polyprenyltransferase